MHWHCEDSDYLLILLVWKVCVMRCFGIVRTIPTSSSSWSTDQTFDLDYALYCVTECRCSSTTLIIAYKNNIVLPRLCFTLWIGYYSGRKNTTVFGWPTLRMSNRMSYFYIEVWSCEMLSLCGKLIWRWNVVFRLRFVFRIPYVNHFVLEKRRLHERYSLASWLFTFEWESVCFENFWKCFDLFKFT